MDTKELIFPEEKLTAYLAKYTQNLISKFSYLLIIFFGVGILIGYQYHNVVLATVWGAGNVSLFLIGRFAPSGLFKGKQRLFAVVTLLLFYMQFSFQAEGHLYIQLMFFVFLSVLILFEDWKSILAFYLLGTLFNAIPFLLETLGTPLFLQSFYQQAVYQELGSGDYFLLMVFGLCHYLLCTYSARYLHINTVKDASYAMYLEEQLNIDANMALAQQITEGEYDREYHLKPYDKMGKALWDMREHMKHIRHEHKQREWHAEGVLLVNRLLINADSLSGMARDITKELSHFLKAFQAGLYVFDKEKAALRLVGHFGYDKVALEQSQEVQVGEGLVGEAFHQQKTIHLKKVPAGHRNVVSGLGEATPTDLLIVPLIFYGKAEGILEIAHFKKFEQFEINFIQGISDNIAASIDSHVNKGRTEKLLQESQQLNNKMKEQEEEMQQNIEVMAMAQRELDERLKSREKLVAAFHHSGMFALLSADGGILKTSAELDKVLQTEKLEHIAQVFTPAHGQEISGLISSLQTGSNIAVGGTLLNTGQHGLPYRATLHKLPQNQSEDAQILIAFCVDAEATAKELESTRQLLAQKSQESSASTTPTTKSLTAPSSGTRP